MLFRTDFNSQTPLMIPTTKMERDKENLRPIRSSKHTLLRTNSGFGRPSSMIGYPSITAGELNVTNYRHAAKYGNLYLRESVAICDPYFHPPPTQLIQSNPSPLIIGSQFHTTNPRPN